MLSVRVLLQPGSKRIDSLRQPVCIRSIAILHAEHGDDALSARNILIQRDGLLLVATHRQEIEDVLVILQRSHHQYQNTRQRSQQPHTESAPALKVVEYPKDESCHEGLWLMVYG